jgi:hypothetical protein
MSGRSKADMKRRVFLVLLSCWFLSACNLQIKQQVQVDLQNIQQSYFEQLYNDSSYVAEAAVLLQTEKLNEAAYYTIGYATGIERRNLYKEVEQEALEKLAKEYDQDVAEQAKMITAKLPDLIRQIEVLLTQKEFSVNSDKWTKLTEKLVKLSTLLWDSPEPLWAIFSYPARSSKEHDPETIKTTVFEAAALIGEIEQEIGTFPNKPAD